MMKRHTKLKIEFHRRNGTRNNTGPEIPINPMLDTPARATVDITEYKLWQSSDTYLGPSGQWLVGSAHIRVCNNVETTL